MLEDSENKQQYDVYVQQSSGCARDLRDATFERSQDRENVLGMNCVANWSGASESLTPVQRAWRAHLAEWMVSTRTMCQTWPNTMDIAMQRKSMDMYGLWLWVHRIPQLCCKQITFNEMCHNFVTCQKRKSVESASLEVSTNALCRIASLWGPETAWAHSTVCAVIWRNEWNWYLVCDDTE